VTNWTIARGDDGVPGRRRAPALTGTTLLMSTDELLAVLEDGAAEMRLEAPARKPERRLRVVPPPDAAGPPDAPAPPAPQAQTASARVLWAPPPAPVERPGLLRRLQCARHGHDPRPHRPQPHDDVCYRCLRCGRPTPPPKRG
jgi:hypothetical protein